MQLRFKKKTTNYRNSVKRYYLFISKVFSTIDKTGIHLIMALLKEDGSLDIERINNLPYEEYMEEMGTLTQEQVKEYISKLPINESVEPVTAIEVDYTLEDELEKGAVLADDLLNKLREKLRRR